MLKFIVLPFITENRFPGEEEGQFARPSSESLISGSNQSDSVPEGEANLNMKNSNFQSKIKQGKQHVCTKKMILCVGVCHPYHSRKLQALPVPVAQLHAYEISDSWPYTSNATTNGHSPGLRDELLLQAEIQT